MNITLVTGDNHIKVGSPNVTIKHQSGTNWNKIKAIDGDYTHMTFDSATNYGMNYLSAITRVYYENADTKFLERCGNLKKIDINIPNITSLNSSFASKTSLSACSLGWADNVISANNCFYACSQLKEFICGNMNNLQYANNMFYYCSSLSSISVSFDLKSARYFAYGCSNLKRADIGNFNDAEDCSYMFQGCTQMESFAAYSMNKTTPLSTASYMFDGCGKLIALNGISGSGCTYPSLKSSNCMFSTCSSLTEADFNMPALTNSSRMFYSCQSLKKVTLASISANCSVSDMFMYCVSLESVNMSLPNTTDLSYLFSSLPKLSSCTLSSCSGCVTGSNMFYYSTALTRMTLGSMPKLKYANRMFHYCNSLTTVSWSDASAVTTTENMFAYDTALTIVYLGTCSSLTNANSMFQGCKSLIAVYQEHLKAENLESAEYMCADCTSMCHFGQLTLPKLKNAAYMFLNCSSLSGYSTMGSLSSLTNATYMFAGCSKLTSGNFNKMSALTTAVGMYSGCTSLTTIINVQTTNNKNLTDATSMFDGCTSLTGNFHFYTDGATTPTYTQLTGCTRMFYNCQNISTVAYLDLSKASSYSNMFYNCKSLTSLVLKGVNQDLDLSACSGLTNWSIGQIYSMAATVSGKNIYFNKAISADTTRYNTAKQFSGKGWTVYYY